MAFCFDVQVCSLSCSGANMKLPRLVYDRLYKYQRQGAVWMWNLYQKGPFPSSDHLHSCRRYTDFYCHMYRCIYIYIFCIHIQRLYKAYNQQINLLQLSTDTCIHCIAQPHILFTFTSTYIFILVFELHLHCFQPYLQFPCKCRQPALSAYVRICSGILIFVHKRKYIPILSGSPSTEVLVEFWRMRWVWVRRYKLPPFWPA